MSTQAKPVLTFADEARAIAYADAQGRKSVLDAVRTIATKRQADILSRDETEVRKALRADIVAAFEASGQFNEASIPVQATRYAAVIVRMAYGDDFSECKSLNEAYALCASRKPRAKVDPLKTAAFKGAGAAEKEMLAKLPPVARHAYAERVVSAVADGLADGTGPNSELSAAIAYAIRFPAEVLALAQAKQTIAKGRKQKAA